MKYTVKFCLPVAANCTVLESSAVSRRKNTIVAFDQLSFLPPTKQDFSNSGPAVLEFQKVFVP